jgi:hypothetical protein
MPLMHLTYLAILIDAKHCVILMAKYALKLKFIIISLSCIYLAQPKINPDSVK